MELLIVIVATVVLAGLLFPALADVRENAHRVVCASNQRQVGMAMFMYDRDYNSLPYTSRLSGDRWVPQELNIAHVGGDEPYWDGIGLLFATGYCRSPNCFYCPSHSGDETAEKNLDKWYHPGNNDLYTNFHYSGDVRWDDGMKRDLSDSLKDGQRMVLLTDMLSSIQELNHKDGLNLLYADGSVHWRDGLSDIERYIPRSSDSTLTDADIEEFQNVWDIIENHGRADEPQVPTAD